MAEQRISLAQRIAERLREDILLGKIAPAQMIMEGHIAEEFNVSKTPVREAMQQLVREELIAVLPKKGYVVRPMTQADLFEVMDMRMLLEPHAAAEAARLATAADIDAMDHLLEIQRQETSSSTARADNAKPSVSTTHAAKEFHTAILDACGNSRLHHTVDSLHAEMVRAHHVIPQLRALIEKPEELEEHEAILAAIKKGDQAGAKAAMQEHLANIRRHISALLRKDSILWD